MLLLTGSLSACDNGVKRAMGLKKHTPDEFMVLSRPPLTVPPDFGLPPPEDSDVRPQSQVRDEAKKVLFNDSQAAGAAKPAPRKDLSRGEAGLLDAAGTADADPNVRAELNAETQAAQTPPPEEQGWFDSLVSPLRPKKKDPLVDIDKEEDRLGKNKEEGKAPNEGDVPVVDKKNKGIINEMLGL
jgi:hypothetical protein